MKKNKIKDTHSLMGLGIQFIILERKRKRKRNLKMHIAVV
jgi:hypothetical protein